MPQTSPTQELIIHTSTASFEETSFVLEQVLGLSFENAEKVFTDMARKGAVCVLSSTPEAIQSYLGKIVLLNKDLENPIKATMEVSGFSSQFKNKTTTTQGPSVVLSFKNFTFAPTDAKDLLVEMLGTTEQYTKNELFLSDYDLYRMLEEMLEGGEVLIKDFGNDEKAQERAHQLSEMLSQSLLLGMDETDPSTDLILDNIGIDVVPPSYTLKSSNSLISMERFIAQDEESAFFEELGEEGVLLQNGYLENILQHHGSVANFLSQATEEELSQYQKIVDKITSVVGEESASSPKPKM